MLTVGLTGNIASGKSSVARVWRALGATVVEADELARRAVAPGTPGLGAIVARWGEGVLLADGTLDRAAVRDLVFRDPAEREWLEGVVHPEVRAVRAEELRRAREAGVPVFVADVPLLFEVGMQDDFDVLVLVDAPEATRLERLVRDRGLPPDEARRMIAAQMPAVLKRAKADVVIENSGTRQELEESARRVWAELLRRAEAAG